MIGMCLINGIVAIGAGDAMAAMANAMAGIWRVH